MILKLGTILTTMVVIPILLATNMYAQVNFIAPEFIGRITNASVTINVVADKPLNYYYQIGTETGIYDRRIPTSASLVSIANEPFEVKIDDLSSNSRYFYRLVYSLDNENTWTIRDEYSFHTHRTAGSDFIFTITSDSHVSSITSNPAKNLYKTTLGNVNDDNPDLHFDLGDTFAMDNIAYGNLYFHIMLVEELLIMLVEEPKQQKIMSGVQIKKNFRLIDPIGNTTFQYKLPKKQHIKIKIFNIMGKEIMDLRNRREEAGIHEVNFDGSKFSAGQYFYKIETEEFSSIKKCFC